MTKARQFKVGDIVISKPVGTRAVFEGRVEEIDRYFYHVRDSEGRLWLRIDRELTLKSTEETP
jgi:hypothetical protein